MIELVYYHFVTSNEMLLQVAIVQAHYRTKREVIGHQARPHGSAHQPF